MLKHSVIKKILTLFDAFLLVCRTVLIMWVNNLLFILRGVQLIVCYKETRLFFSEILLRFLKLVQTICIRGRWEAAVNKERFLSMWNIYLS